jgi:ketosteroid isomerase-like protein
MSGLPHDAVESILKSNDAWHRRDLDGVVAPYSADFEWDTTGAWPDGRVYRGLDHFRAYCQEVLDRWGPDDMRLDIQEMLAVEGTTSVVVRYRMTGRSAAGVPVVGEWVHVFDFEDGLIVRGRNFRALHAALEALGGPASRVWPE